jgi:hypothetical protein
LCQPPAMARQPTTRHTQYRRSAIGPAWSCPSSSASKATDRPKRIQRCGDRRDRGPCARNAACADVGGVG